MPMFGIASRSSRHGLISPYTKKDNDLYYLMNSLENKLFEFSGDGDFLGFPKSGLDVHLFNG